MYCISNIYGLKIYLWTKNILVEKYICVLKIYICGQKIGLWTEIYLWTKQYICGLNYI